MRQSSKSYSVKDLAARLSRSTDPAEVARVARQVKHWTLTGLLTVSGDKHSGTGNYRRYEQDELYRAALIMELTRYSIQVGVIKDMLLFLRLGRTEAGRDRHTDPWQDAIEGKRAVYALFQTPGKSGAGFCELDLDPPIPPHDWPSAVLVNLTALFAQVGD